MGHTPPPDTPSGIPPSPPCQNDMKRGVNTIDEISGKNFGKLESGYYLCLIMENKISTVCKVEGSYETLAYLNDLVLDGKLLDVFNEVPEMEDFEIEEVELVFESLDKFLQVILYFNSELVPPFNVMEYLFNHLYDKMNDDTLIMEGEYYNFDYSELGVFSISDNQGVVFEDGYPMVSEEEYMEENNSGFYFEDEIVPTLEGLRKNMGISVYSY